MQALTEAAAARDTGPLVPTNAPAPAPPANEAHLVPHQGLVTLASDSNGLSVLVHAQTLERMVLQGEGPWALEFDDAGYGCVTSPGKDAVLLEDLLRLQLYKSEDDKLIILERGIDANKMWSLTDAMRQYRSGVCRWSYAPVHTAVLPFCTVIIPRGGCRFFFCAAEVYKQLGLTSYKGSPSKWIYETAKAWERHLEAMGYKDWLLHSPAGEAVNDALNSTTHFLPWIGISTLALIVVYIRLSHPVKQKGGLTCASQRIHCQSVFEGMLTHIARSDFELLGAWEIPLVWLFTWTNDWPRPSFYKPSVLLPVSSEGIVDLGHWVDFAAALPQRSSSPARKWLGLIERFGRHCHLVSLLLAVGHADADFRAMSLLGQLVKQVAIRFEAVAKLLAKRERPATGASDLEVHLHDASDMIQTPRDIDVLLIRHVESSKFILKRSSPFLSMSVDKAWIKGLNLFNGVLVTAGNVACCCPPQVDEAFQPTPESEAAKTPEELAIIANEQNDRHKVWIEKSRASGSKCDNSWRPRKMHRLAAAKVLRHMDNQVRVMTGLGLKRFAFDLESVQSEDPEDWPHLTVSSDRGSDNHSALYAVMYKPEVQLNISMWWDPSHDGWRSVLEAVRQSGLFGFTIMVMIVANLAHGPDGTDMRYGQLRCAAEELFKVHNSSTCVLFKHYVRELLAEVGSDLTPLENETREQALWRHIETCSIFRPKGYRANLNRFQSVIREGRSLLRRWWCTLFVAEFCGLEMGMLTPAALRAKLRMRHSGGDGDADAGGTSAVQVHDRTIRSAAQNAVVVAILALQEQKHHRLLSIVVHCATPVDLWHSQQNKALRSTSGASTWAVAQVGGSYMDHICEVMDAPAMESIALECGFGVPGGEGGSYKYTEEAVMGENDFSAVMGTFSLKLVVARLNRFLPNLISWPWSMLRVLAASGNADSIVAEFKQHYDDFEALKSIRSPTEAVKELIRRSPFNMLSTMQLVRICEANDWKCCDALRQVMRGRSSAVLGTQVVEDMNNVMKNTKSFAGCASTGLQHYRRPETGFVSAVLRGVVDKVHEFKAPELKTSVVRRSAALEQSCFKSGHSSMQWQSIASTKPSPDWWSPSPANSAIPAADHILIREALSTNALGSLQSAWLGSWCDASSQIVCHFEGEAQDKWWLALHHFDNSCALFWPVALDAIVLNQGHIVVSLLRATEPHLKPIVRLAGITGFTFKFMSWAWQRPFVAREDVRPAVRGVRMANTEVDEILKVLARNAFFTMPKNRISDFLEHAGHASRPGDESLFDVTFAGAQVVLGTSDSETMEILKKRFSRLPSETEYLADLLEVDEAAVCLDEADRKEVVKAREAAVQNQEERKEFTAGFRRQRERMGGQSIARGPKKARTSPLAGWRGPRKILEPEKESILQKDLKKFTPPGGFIWVSRTSKAWCVRMPPLKQFSAYWKRYDSEEAAARAALAHLWREYLDMEGLCEDDCPIANIFTQGAASSSSGA